jgi:hypothetical protein
MLKRLLLSLALTVVFIPFTASADEMPAPVTVDNPAPTTQQMQPDSSASAGLGPQSSNSVGSSSADSGTLQPAGTSPLQSTTSDSTGLTAPSNALQAPASSDQTLRVIMGDSDGSPHNLAESSSGGWAWLAWTVLLCGIIAVVALSARRLHSIRLPRLTHLRLPGRRPH